MQDAAIRVEGLSKLYRLEHAHARANSFRDLLTGIALAPLRRFKQLRQSDASLEDFWALKDVSFTVERGEVIGIIGRNGAGKSTLLKVLSRIVEPTRGQAVLRGRVASLLEVGTGFHPELSGRENVYLNGSILGMKRREIESRFDDIVAFAEIEQFLDTPVKRYSSGMYVRLAFAVAAHLHPEILIVDEVLAVGDAEFQRKCLGKIREVSASGSRTVLFVSHNMAAVTSLCSRAILLEHGRVVRDGPASEVAAAYLSPQKSSFTGVYSLLETTARPPEFPPQIAAAAILDKESLEPVSAVLPLQVLQMDVELRPLAPMRTPMIYIGFSDSRGEKVFAIGSYFSPTPLGRADGPIVASVTFTMPPLYPGRYDFEIGLMPHSGRFVDHVAPAGGVEVLHGDLLQTSYPYFAEMGALLVPSAWETKPGPCIRTSAEGSVHLNDPSPGQTASA